MAKTNPITTATAKVTASSQTYSGANKVTFPFQADRVMVAIISSTGPGSLVLSLDGVTDSMTLHNTSGVDTFTLEQQRASELYYRVDAASTSYTFVVNAETPAWPNIF
jgi:hypothetical protein